MQTFVLSQGALTQSPMFHCLHTTKNGHPEDARPKHFAL
ncbi:conserved hypothetical protein [Roseibium sp. TrichSKD4]|nr:conserved hypothetical protein [Roseibium sp. TrichSKD4]